MSTLGEWEESEAHTDDIRVQRLAKGSGLLFEERVPLEGIMRVDVAVHTAPLSTRKRLRFSVQTRIGSLADAGRSL